MIVRKLRMTWWIRHTSNCLTKFTFSILLRLCLPLVSKEVIKHLDENDNCVSKEKSAYFAAVC